MLNSETWAGKRKKKKKSYALLNIMVAELSMKPFNYCSLHFEIQTIIIHSRVLEMRNPATP
jgi:hypothetical protein